MQYEKTVMETGYAPYDENGTTQSIVYERTQFELGNEDVLGGLDILLMPGKDGTGPRGNGPRDGSGGGKGNQGGGRGGNRGNGGQGPKKGGRKGGC